MAMNKDNVINPFKTWLASNYPDFPAQDYDALEKLVELIFAEIVNGAIVETTVPATGILDSDGFPCTGSASGTGSVTS